MGKEILTLATNKIETRIFTIRGLQVMLDRDLAELYGVEIKRLNEQVKRNIERFPDDFMFQLNDSEFNDWKSQFVTSALRSQNATLKNDRGKHRKYLPFAFTEQGVAGLSGVLKSETAAKVHVAIMRAFVAMRRFISANTGIIQRLETVEQKQITTDKKIDKIFDALQSKTLIPKCGIFFNGQIFDAYILANKIIKSAKQSIILIDNYIDESVLTMFSKKAKNVRVTLLTKNISKQLDLDLAKFNQQYPSIEARTFEVSHDRFLIIDSKEVYHLGASLKDLGKKWFAFSKMEGLDLLERVKKS